MNIRSTLLLALGLSVTAPCAAQLPKFDMTPGKWAYTTRTEIPGVGSIPMSFDQCVTQKDIDEGRNLSSAKEAGQDCKYSDVKSSANRYQFVATCKTKDSPEPMVMTYDMTVSNKVQFDAKMTMTGGAAKQMGGKINMTMTAKRAGNC